MFTYLRQLWHSPDLKKRILATLGILVVYRLVAHLSVPGANVAALNAFLDARGGTGMVGVFAALTGGAIDNFSVLMLGLSPYINASIIVQLCTVIFPKFEAMSKEGQQGQQQLNRYMRWITPPLALLQSYGFLVLLSRQGINIVDTTWPGVLFPMLFVTAGSVFLLWLGEMISEKGIGNGISLIIFTGIITGIPSQLSSAILSGQGESAAFVIFIIASLLMLIATVLFTDAHRFIPITYANQGASRGVQGGIPIRLNQAGMIPLIFAVSLISFPSILAQFFAATPSATRFVSFVNTYLNPQNPSAAYLVAYFVLVVAFTYFYVSVTFKPADLAEQIQKRGGFIPGVRPGPQTAKVLERTSGLLNLWGGVFLGVLAVVPLIFTSYTNLNQADLLVSGSSLIIIVGTVMELIRQVNAQMLAHDYDKLI